MIRVNDFLADFEAHHAPPSNLKISDCAARAGLWEFVRGRRIASKPCLVSRLSLASYLANGQGFAVALIHYDLHITPKALANLSPGLERSDNPGSEQE